MSKAKSLKNAPSLKTTFEAIQRECGKHLDKASQEQFLQAFLRPKSNGGLDADQAAAQASLFRTQIGEKMRGRTNPMLPTERVQSKGGSQKNYGINELFQYGPKKTLQEAWLESLECDFDDEDDLETDDEEEDVPLKDVVGKSAKTSKTSSGLKPGASNAAVGTKAPQTAKALGAPSSDLVEARADVPESSTKAAPTTAQQTMASKAPAIVIDEDSPPKRKADAIIEEIELGSRKKQNTGPSQVIEGSGPLKRKADAVIEQNESEARKKSNRGPARPQSPKGASTSSPTRRPTLKLKNPGAASKNNSPQPPSKQIDIETGSGGASEKHEETVAPHVHPKPPTVDADELRKRNIRADTYMNNPSIHPTKMPASMVCQQFLGCSDWVGQRMNSLQTALFSFLGAYGQEHNIDWDSPPEFVVNPPPELRELYQALVGGRGRWEAWVAENEGARALKQDFTLVALMGVKIFKDVFEAPLPWDLHENIPKALGKDFKYWEIILNKMGHDPDDFLMYIAGEKHKDPEFHETEVADLAEKLAGSLAHILLPHLRKLVKRTTPDSEKINYPKWMKSLEEAYRNAIEVKHILRVSQLGPFEFTWPEAGSPLDAARHRCYDIAPSNRILHTVLPLIERISVGDRLPHIQALVMKM